VLVKVIYPTVDSNSCHQDPKTEEKEIESHQDPEHLISQNLFKFDPQ